MLLSFNRYADFKAAIAAMLVKPSPVFYWYQTGTSVFLFAYLGRDYSIVANVTSGGDLPSQAAIQSDFPGAVATISNFTATA